MNTLIAVVAAYLLGSVSFAVVMSRLFGLSDPRTYGSKNPGATNVLRSGSKKAAIATLVGDAAKGWLAVWLAVQFGEQYGIERGGVARDVGFAALGHHQFTALAGLVGVQNLAGGRVFAADGLRARHGGQEREQRNEGKAVHGGLRFGARATAPVFIIVVV